MTNMPCPFCAIVYGEDDEDLIAFRSERVFVVPTLKQRPLNSGQVLVCPIAHEVSLHQISSSLRAALDDTVLRVMDAAADAFGAVGTTLMLNQSAPDQDIDHLHIHVIPRFLDDKLTIPNPDRSPAPRNVRAQLAARLRAALRKEDC
jgi:histidine triad (HIT) family protein